LFWFSLKTKENLLTNLDGYFKFIMKNIGHSTLKQPQASWRNSRISVLSKNRTRMHINDERVGWYKTLEKVEEAWDEGLDD
jgi:hypothetical protein